MPYCSYCHEEFSVASLNVDGRCAKCAAEVAKITKRLPPTRTASAPLAPAAPKFSDDPQPKIILTTEKSVSLRVEKRLGIVSAEAVVGMNVFKDVVTELRDLVGGYSRTQQRAMEEIKAELLNRLERQALRRGGNMIVAVDLRFSDFGVRGGAILATAIGTAVKVDLSSPDA